MHVATPNLRASSLYTNACLICASHLCPIKEALPAALWLFLLSQVPSVCSILAWFCSGNEAPALGSTQPKALLPCASICRQHLEGLVCFGKAEVRSAMCVCVCRQGSSCCFCRLPARRCAPASCSSSCCRLCWAWATTSTRAPSRAMPQVWPCPVTHICSRSLKCTVLRCSEEDECMTVKPAAPYACHICNSVPFTCGLSE